MRSNERNGSTVLERGFRLLDAFGPEGGPLSLAELVRRTQLPKATVLRLARQLVEVQALERLGDSYRLGIRLFELGSSVSRQRRLRDAALPFMEDLYEVTHEVVHLGVRDGLNVLYVEKIHGRHSAVLPTQAGMRIPLYCTGLGKAILAHSDPSLFEAVVEAGLPSITQFTITTRARLAEEIATARVEGVAYDRDEYQLGITCVAAALVGPDHRAQGALSVTGRTGHFQAGRVATAVRTAALALSRTLNWSPWPT